MIRKEHIRILNIYVYIIVLFVHIKDILTLDTRKTAVLTVAMNLSVQTYTFTLGRYTYSLTQGRKTYTQGRYKFNLETHSPLVVGIPHQS